jgi:lipid-binding SYLF domain-containing protein
MKFKLQFFLLIIILFISSGPVLADEYAATKKMFVDAGVGDLFESAYGYALFPTIGKAGFVVGGAYGKGRVYAGGKYVANTSMTQATLGFQLGGTGFSQVVFFQEKRAFATFASGSFEFGAGIQATVLTAATNVSVNTGGSSATASGGKNNANTARGGYNNGMATFTITKGGLMYEASLGGQKFSFSRR